MSIAMQSSVTAGGCKATLIYGPSCSTLERLISKIRDVTSHEEKVSVSSVELPVHVSKKKRFAIHFVKFAFVRTAHVVGLRIYKSEKGEVSAFRSSATLMERFRGVASIIVALLLGCFSPWIHGKFVPEDFDQKLVALFKVIDYVHRRPYQMNADATFGITMAEANIAAMLMHKNAEYLGSEYLNILSVILKLCDSTRRYLISKVVSENENVQLLQETLNSPALWMRGILWKESSSKTQPSPTPGLTYRSIFDLIMQGTPKEEESDRCLADIIRHRLHGVCRVPETCVKIFSRKYRSRGYPLTHKLLILKVTRALGCEEHEHEYFAELIHSYCSAIFQDLIDIETKGFPYNTRDLMMEQVLLCGMEGYLEFTGKHNADLILSWSHSSGCFSSFGRTGQSCEDHHWKLILDAIVTLLASVLHRYPS